MKPTQLAAGALALAELTKSAFVTPPSLTGEVKPDQRLTVKSTDTVGDVDWRMREAVPTKYVGGSKYDGKPKSLKSVFPATRTRGLLHALGITKADADTPLNQLKSAK